MDYPGEVVRGVFDMYDHIELAHHSCHIFQYDELKVDSGMQYSPDVDPIQGDVINRLPVCFTKDVGVKREDGEGFLQ